MPKNKPNQYTVFIKEVLRPEKESRGMRVSNAELYNEAFKRFEDLSQEQKNYYKAKAKELRPVNVSNQFFNEPKAQSLAEQSSGFAITNLVDEDKKVKEMEKAVQKRIEKVLSMDELKRKEFIFVSVQCFLETKPNVRPLEIAMVRWSMIDGIKRTFSQLVHPGKIPLGLRSSVTEFAEKTHLLSEDKYCMCTSDYDALWDEIMDFITCNGEIQPLYSFQWRSCQLSMLCLEWLSCQVPAGKSVLVKVDAVESLYAEMMAKAGYHADVGFLRDFLSKHNFDLSDSLRCNFHANNISEHCAMAFCKKPLYNILNNLSQIYDFKLTENHKQANKVILSTNNIAPEDPDMVNKVKVERTQHNAWTRENRGEGLINIKKEEEDNEPFQCQEFGRGIRSDLESFPPLSLGRAIPVHQNLNSPRGGAPSAAKPPLPNVGRGRGRGTWGY